MMYPITFEQKVKVRKFLSSFPFTREMYEVSYQSWGNGGHGWTRTLESGGTDTMNVIMWYQHFHKPGSREWRPTVIMNALISTL